LEKRKTLKEASQNKSRKNMEKNYKKKNLNRIIYEA